MSEETKKVRNHTDLPKTVAVTCEGVVIKGKRTYAEGHNKLRLVHPQDAKQCKRCVECQKMSLKYSQQQSAGKRRERKQVLKSIERGEQAKVTLEAHRTDLGKDQIADLEAAIAAGAAASTK